MEILEYNGTDFKTLMEFEGWKIGFCRYSERFSAYTVEERHLETDEAFVLLAGSATLYENGMPHQMELCKVYNVKKGNWHHCVLSEDATVMVVENQNTSKSNTEKRSVSNAHQ